MFQSRELTIKGTSPLIMHNGRLADPLDPFSKEMKRLSGKRKKTDEDMAVMAVMEWCGGLYHSEGDIEIADGMVKWGNGIIPIVPAALIEACIAEGAKKSKLGKQAKAGVIVNDDVPLKDRKSVV